MPVEASCPANGEGLLICEMYEKAVVKTKKEI